MKGTNLATSALVIGIVAIPLLVLSFIFWQPPAPAQLSSPVATPQDSISISALSLVSEAAFLRSFQPSLAALPSDGRGTLSLESVFPNGTAAFVVRNWDVAYPTVDAAAAFAFSVENGQVLYSKNALFERPIASLTKLMTALVAAENFNPDELLTISNAAASVEEKTAGLVAGDLLTVRDVLYALLLESGNDAAVALEEHYNTTRAQSSASFVARMNEKAAELRLANTSFSDPSGLEPQDQSAAFDVAQMLYVVFQNNMLRDMLGTHTYSATAENGTHYEWHTSDELLERRSDIRGGKTGYTEEAGQSLAVVAMGPQGNLIIAVVLGAGDRERETAALLDWIYSAYVWE
jgi:serine-type D-Ala-D-Ala carboxypeptidase (penicillin-binding protein 5/6)